MTTTAKTLVFSILLALSVGCGGPSKTALDVASHPCPYCDGGNVGVVHVFDGRELIGEGWQCLDCRERLD